MKSGKKLNSRIFFKLTLMVMIFSLLSGNLITIAQARSEDYLEDYRGHSSANQSIAAITATREASFGIATGDPNGPHSQYAWPFTVDQMGHVIQSYQNYSSGISQAYFHHGIDMIAPNGTQVFTRSGGQVVNIENYQPGNALYWEVAILDSEGYVWQYHHIDRNTIPQMIFDKFNEWKANPSTGGYVPPNTHIGNIVYWTVTSFGYRFNHIHLNIIAAGDVYLDPLEFHIPLEDNQAPEIHAIGLLNGNTIVSGNTASGDYGLYVRARDLFKSPVYYLPPYKTEFSINGGEWTTVWEFHDLPGGASDTLYLHDFFVPNSTKGNYSARDFYINLGFIPGGKRSFPSEPGEHTIQVRVWDYNGNSTTDSFTWTVTSTIPDNGCSLGNGVTRTFTIDEDILVTDVNLGLNITHARRGQIRVTLKSPTDSSPTTIIANSSDTYANYDVWVDDSSTNPLNNNRSDNVAAPFFDRIVSPNPDGSLDSFNGKPAFGEWTVFICDNTRGTTGSVNQVELEVIGTSSHNEPPTADPQSLTTDEDIPLAVTLSGSDPDGDSISFAIVDQPSHGTLTGQAPNLTYTPHADYYGEDSFTYIANDGKVNSAPATISITINPVNDAPVANDQSVSTGFNMPIAITLSASDVDGDDLTFTVISQPAHGSLSGSVPDLFYTPGTGFTGEDTFTFIASDGELDSEIATVNITVNPPGPTAIFWDDFESDLGWVRNPNGTDTATLGLWERGIPQRATYNNYVTQLGEPVSGSYDLVTGRLAGSSAGDYDVDNGVTSIRSPIINLPSNADVTLSFHYYLAHLNNANNQDYFRVKIVGNSTQTVFEKLGTASYVNAVWKFESVEISQFAGQAIYILIEAADEGAGSLIEAAVDDVLIEGVFTSTNMPPVAEPQSLTTNAGEPLSISLTGYDPDGDSISFAVVDLPLNGLLSGEAPDLTYTPNPGFYGEDSFTFKVNDGAIDSEVATISITINPVNSAPVADTQFLTTDEDEALEITLTGSDIDGDDLTFTIVDNPAHGNLQGDPPNLTYTPNQDFNGEDSFTFIVNDGILDSELATISITINPVNDAPIADDQLVQTNRNRSLPITLTGSDVDDDLLTFHIVSGPFHGTLNGEPPELTYIPNAGFSGTDSFEFTAFDGQAASLPALVTIIVDDVNNPPMAEEQSLSTDEDVPLDIMLSGSDPDNDPITYTIVDHPSFGVLSGEAPNLTYTPDPDYHGEDSFTFMVFDGQLTSDPATVAITINPVNDVPVVEDQSLTTDEDVALEITLTAFDVDGDDLDYILVTGPNHGNLEGNAPTLTYIPEADYYGEDSFTFKVNDGTVDSAVATISITINPVNDAPVVDNQSLTTDEDEALEITLTGSDVDGDDLTFTIVNNPAHGSLEGDAPNLTYTPDQDFNGEDSFTFIVNDGILDSEVATVSITINSINDAPIADDQLVQTNRNKSVTITLTGSDVDGDVLTFNIVSDPIHGTLNGEPPELTYTPHIGYVGTDNFEFVVYDGEFTSDPALVSITVMDHNDPPKADELSFTTDEDVPLDIMLSGSDPDNDPITYMILDHPSFGVLSGEAPNLTYTPDPDYHGEDSFTFAVFDGQLTSDPATVTITINPVNDPPLADAQSLTTDEDVALEITLTAFDVDGDDLDYILVTSPNHGSLEGNAPILTYIPEADYYGEDSFTFKVNDGTVDSAVATINITINPVNDAPVADDQSLTIDEDEVLEITLTGSDVDGDELTFSIINPPAHGSLSGIAPNLLYTPETGFTGEDTFTFNVNDGELDSDIATIKITVNSAGPAQVFWDDFESDLGWIRNPNGTDTATLGLWERGIPQRATYNNYVTQLGTPVSGSYDLVTGRLAGSSAGDYDVDGGVTSIRSPLIQLPANHELSLSFYYYLAHLNNATSADYFRVKIIGDSTQTVFEKLASAAYVNAIWQPVNVDISRFAGQSVYILIEAADEGAGSLIEAAVDDVLITADKLNLPPVADPQNLTLEEDGQLLITLTGSDPEGNPLSFELVDLPQHGSITGTPPNITYKPDPDYYGLDSFSFSVNDGALSSSPAIIGLEITPVNDAPVAESQGVTTQEGTAIEILLVGSDVDGDSLTYSVFNPPSHGTLTGTAPNLLYTPHTGFVGSDTFTFKVNDGELDSDPATVSITVESAGPETIFFDDFETNKGWIRNPSRKDTATLGYWERAIPQSVYYVGYKQLTAYSGSYDLVTGPLAGPDAGSYDLDGGVTSIRSPNILLPANKKLTLSFYYYLAHYTNSSSADYFRVKIVGTRTQTVFEKLGAARNVNAVWQLVNVDISSFAGQTVYILIEAADAGTASLVEAAVDDVLILAE